MVGVLCGLDKTEEIAIYCQEKAKRLKKIFKVESTPSESTMNRVLNMVNGSAVTEIIIEIMRESAAEMGKIVAVNGKTIRRTAKKGKKNSAMQIITAYLTQSGVVLGQEMIGEKTNEIPVFQAMLGYIEVRGKTITADSLHCQTATCREIMAKKGNYVIGLKQNQKTFYEEVKVYIDDPANSEGIEIYSGKIEKNRDRIERRECYKIKDVRWLSMYKEWSGLKSAFAVKRTTITKEKTTEETGYYITSLESEAQELMKIVRDHWKIESMHWMLDVVFTEDECKLLSRDGQKSMNIFRKFALLLHRQYMAASDYKSSLKSHMFKSLLDDDLLLALF
jgi:predicted transposase YbfD/YdcC